MITFALRTVFTLLVLSIVATGCSGVEAADGKKSEEGASTVLKTQDGLRFNLPPDWPVEKRGGMVGPIPIEEYLARKFKALESQLQAIEQRLNGLDVRLRVVEEEVKKQRQGLRVSEQTTAAVGEP